MGRREIFAGNWKMYKKFDEAKSVAEDLIKGLGDTGSREVVIFPPSPWARDLCGICSGSSVDIGMQNMYFEDEGAFTGEVSPLMVKDAGCKYILIGHSERRHVFGETDEDVNKKVKAAFVHDIEPMLCVGELLDDREAGTTDKVLKLQIEGALKDISADQMKKVVIAYEPVWAIGTGKVATPEIAQDSHKVIRELLTELFGEVVANEVPVLYGGSVKPDNIAGLFEKPDIDGVLVGGASLKADSFLAIATV